MCSFLLSHKISKAHHNFVRKSNIGVGMLTPNDLVETVEREACEKIDKFLVENNEELLTRNVAMNYLSEKNSRLFQSYAIVSKKPKLW